MQATLTPVQRTLSGQFRLSTVSADCWRIDNLAPPHESLWLRRIGAQTTAQASAVPQRLDCLTVVWRADGGADVTLVSRGESVTVGASTAMLHEPRERLYDSLPLPQYTRETARFWRRVFRIVRIPGGRLLLGLLARRSRRAV